MKRVYALLATEIPNQLKIHQQILWNRATELKVPNSNAGYENHTLPHPI